MEYVRLEVVINCFEVLRNLKIIHSIILDIYFFKMTRTLWQAEIF